MGSRAISEALDAFAHDVLSGQQAEAVRHVATLFDRILAYRNYYVHGIILAGDFLGPASAGAIRTTTAKRKVAYHWEDVTLAQLHEFQRWTLELARYATDVMFSLFFDLGGPVPLPDKPLPPATLVKPRHTWRELRCPQAPSEG
jgi:hypothetical protein